MVKGNARRVERGVERKGRWRGSKGGEGGGDAESGKPREVAGKGVLQGEVGRVERGRGNAKNGKLEKVATGKKGGG